MLNAKQRKSLRKLPARQRAAAEQNMRAQNARKRTGAQAPQQGGGRRRKTNGASADGKNHMHLRALNPFDATPGYQLTPMIERTLKAKLVCDTSFPVTVPDGIDGLLVPYAGKSLGLFSPNATQLGVIKYAHLTQYNPSVAGTASQVCEWSNRISDKDYLARAANWGISLRYCGEARYARGEIAVVFVDHIEGAHFNQLDTLGKVVDSMFSHPRAAIIDVVQLTKGPVSFAVPVLDEISHRSWKRVLPSGTDTYDVGQSGVAEPVAPEKVEQSTPEQKYNFGFRSVVIAARGVYEDRSHYNQTDFLSALRVRSMMDVEYRRGVDNDAGDGDDNVFRNYATTNPSVAPATTHSFMQRAGQLVDTVRDALSHPIAGMIMNQLGNGLLALPAAV